MKTSPINKTSGLAVCLAAVTLLACAGSVAMAQKAQIINRPLTPTDLATYKLPATTELSSGLDAVGVGTAVYLEALVVKGTPVTGIDWGITNRPSGSTAALSDSPLDASIPSWEPSDRLDYDIAGRRLLVPDKNGQYSVVATVSTTTNTFVISHVFTAANYAGAGYVDGNNIAVKKQCGSCHDGGLLDDKLTPWSKTAHASMLAMAVDGLKGSHYSSNLVSYHSVGYNTSLAATNGGFDDVQKQLGWAFPANLTNGNWAAMPAALKQMSNIQCENCHGPGGEHNGNPTKTAVSFGAGSCAVCHSYTPEQWAISKHAIAVREESADCAGCHSGIGFVDRITGAANIRTDYSAITCTTCHDPHDATNPSQLRSPGVVTLKDTSKAGGATVIADAGKGAMCMQCHMSRRDAVSYVTKTVPNVRFGPHHGPQADMLAGVNAITYDRNIPSSAHADMVADACVTCHMQSVASTDSAFLKAGGHTFNMSCEVGTNTVALVAACKTCHGPSVTSFDMARVDYDGNGVVEGVQTEVKGLINQLSLLLPPLGKQKATLTEMGSAMAAYGTNYTMAQRKGAYNLLFVLEDKSFGVHNTAYAVGLLKASIADLGGAPSTGIGPTVTDVNNAIANYFAKSTNYVTSPVSLGKGMFQLGVDDNLIGWNLGVQVSSDLTTWTNLPTSALPVYQFNDPDATNAPKRFYRLRFP